MASGPALPWKSAALALLPILAVLLCRGVGPDDPDSNDQGQQALYVLDIWQNGNWILPMEQGIYPLNKPPLYYWMATLFSLLTGGPTLLSCRLPSALATLLTAWLIFRIAIPCSLR